MRPAYSVNLEYVQKVCIPLKKMTYQLEPTEYDLKHFCSDNIPSNKFRHMLPDLHAFSFPFNLW